MITRACAQLVARRHERQQDAQRARRRRRAAARESASRNRSSCCSAARMPRRPKRSRWPPGRAAARRVLTGVERADRHRQRAHRLEQRPVRLRTARPRCAASGCAGSSRNSDRYRPMPSAPASRTRATSSAISRLASSRIRTPSAVAAGRVAQLLERAQARPRATAARCVPPLERVARTGSTTTSPVAPSSASVWPGRDAAASRRRVRRPSARRATARG